MLRELLSHLASGDTRSLNDLALALGLSRPEIEEMLARLCSLGYVEELSSSLVSSCSDGEGKACALCSGCGFVSSCGQAPTSRVWALTQKGKEASSDFAYSGVEILGRDQG